MSGDNIDLKIADVFNVIRPELESDIPLQVLLERLENAGILDQRDPRLENLRGVIKEIAGKSKCYYDIQISLQGFTKIVNVNRELLLPAFLDNLVIPRFLNFVCQLQALYEKELNNDPGEIYKKPSACNDNPVDTWGVAVTSVDGQRCFIGDSDKSFLLHSICKPLIYGMAIDELGALEVEKYLGHESIHTQTDLLCLDHQDRPRSPLLASGFLVLCFLLFRNKDFATTIEQHRKVFRFFHALAGNEYCQHRTQVYMTAKQSGFIPFAVANLLVAMEKLPMDPNFNEACDFYYEAHSIEANCESLSLIAATLANGGINPLTLKQVLSPNAVKYVLSSMYTAGLYTFSGKSSFMMGNPGKSTRSGAIMYVIPGVLGIALYSPKLNEDGISVRGLSFMKEFIHSQKFHIYANLTSRVKKKFPGRKNILDECNTYCDMFSALASHDIPKVVKLSCTDMVHSKDNEQRTILHVAAAMGYNELVKHITSKNTYLVNEKDRWGRTPLDYAKISGCHGVIEILQEWEKIMQPTK